ncbi:TRAP transporter small permease [Marinimicrobium sp. ARAG 43.8]|uniref:TRAP transporter small permease n=1 Tax=Marinimicrobium sp. ARAG 43.8 TaxID=3418719 RepID=UPI003CEA1F93
MNSLMKIIDRVLGWVLMVLMAVMVLDVTWQVITRFVLSEPSSITEELARFLLVWIGLLGAAYAFRVRAHLGLDIVTANLEPKAQLRVEILVNVLCFLFAAVVMVIGGAKLMLLTLELNQLSPALQVPMGYIYSVVPLSGILICLFAIDHIRLRELPLVDDDLPVD